ncbi:hypothetical protein D3C78_1854990 [compost metagenome]
MGGEADLARAAIEQGAAEAGFQGLDAAGQRRLTEVDRLRRAGEVAVLGEGDEVAELAKIVHARPASKMAAECIGIISRLLPACPGQ